MVNKKISELPAAGTITGTETLPIVQGGATAQATVNQLLALVIAGASSNLDSFFEVATRFGLDEATVTTLQGLVAGKADTAAVAATYVTKAELGGSTASGIVITPDPTDAGVAIISFPAFLLDPTDSNVLILPIGA